ncbi:MAG: FMN-binding protein [Brevinema sp.]
MFKKFVIFSLFMSASLTYAQNATYKGTSTVNGYRGPISVEVVVAGDKISSIKVTSSKEDRPKNSIDLITATMIRENNINVDVVSGATRTSRSFISAVGEALKTSTKNFKGALVKPSAK